MTLYYYTIFFNNLDALLEQKNLNLSRIMVIKILLQIFLLYISEKEYKSSSNSFSISRSEKGNNNTRICVFGSECISLYHKLFRKYFSLQINVLKRAIKVADAWLER